MAPMERYRRGLPVVVRLDDGHARIVAALVEMDGVLLFADIGWSDAAGRHPFHVVPEDASVEALEDGDPQAHEWNAWLETPEPGQRARAEELLRQFWRETRHST